MIQERLERGKGGTKGQAFRPRFDELTTASRLAPSSRELRFVARGEFPPNNSTPSEVASAVQ
jgi:hypothetical protein